MFAFSSFQCLQPTYEHCVEAGTLAEQTSIQIGVLFACFCRIWLTVGDMTHEVKFNCIYNKVTRCV